MNGESEIPDPEVLLTRAESHLSQRDLHSALRDYERAEALGADPDRCSAGRWVASMLGGDFGSAWRESDAIRCRGGPDFHRFWNGEQIAGKRVIIRCLHGFGDAVQLLRYAPQLRALAADVIWEVPPRLLELAPFFAGVDRVITWGDRAPLLVPAWDVQIEVMELPYLFRTEAEHLPIAERYLHLPTPLTESIQRTLGPAEQRRIGLVWESGDWNPSRSVHLATLSPLSQLHGVEWWNLQGGAAHAESSQFGQSQMRTYPGAQDSILALAALISQLDLVITVDTLAAHLAGALGVPCWVLLQHAADWRWMIGRTDSPWYRSLHLFRQRRPGDWHSAVHDLQEALTSWIPQANPQTLTSR